MSKELPEYQCHKKVRALKIESIGHRPGGAILHFHDFDPIRVDQTYVERNDPKAGGYYVVYEDGYQSFSPAQAFESGYTKT